MQFESIEKCSQLLFTISLCKKCILLVLRVRLGTRPACQHKGNLVDEIGNVVGHVESLCCPIGIVDLAKEVSCRVDRPSQAHDDAHVVERRLDSLRRTAGPIGALAALRMRLNSIICRGTVMVQSM